MPNVHVPHTCWTPADELAARDRGYRRVYPQDRKPSVAHIDRVMRSVEAGADPEQAIHAPDLPHDPLSLWLLLGAARVAEAACVGPETRR